MPRHGATLSVIAQVKCCDLTAIAMYQRLVGCEKLAGTWQIILRHNAVEIKGRGRMNFRREIFCEHG
ncbi:hypothetical protein DUA64_26090 [Salmonella enterica subsp. enterica serovar Abony]|nr:hypothetical protein [Salmonella enterica subsp. enterica serovar Abony]EBY6401640.1 hypothetical protein [Salmonella enterica subsp. enterica serovar Abony]EDH1237993.1 hypothetical protein [Salmonella enterica subsp. enterica]EDH3764292.1 hypothetical protein [Salmonella enterica subsp. enterica]